MNLAVDDMFSHEALLYAGEADLIARVVPFLRDGVRAGDAVMVALRAAGNARLAEALGDDAHAVTFVDMGDVGRNPARIIPAWQDFRTANRGRRVRGVGEPIHTGRGPDELVECQLHEALLNVAFDGAAGFELLCPYDTETLAPEVLHEARCSHPIVRGVDGVEPSREYRGLEDVAAPFETPLPSPPVPATLLSFDRTSYRDVRSLVVDMARGAGLTIEQTDDLVLAVHELAANSVRHGGGRGVLRAWQEQDAVVCEIRDQGRISDRLVGRRTPAPDGSGGRGVWLANRLCDLVQVRSLASGTVVRVRLAAG